jgi:hypothetical protein
MAFGFLLLLVLTSSVSADDCNGCDRGAIVSKCENPDWPANFDELSAAYDECMERELPKDDPSITITDKPDAFARQRCRHLKPRLDYTTASSIATWIAELHTSACFHMIRTDVVDAYRERGEREGWGDLIKPAKYKIPEYAFEVVFDAVSNEAHDTEGNPGSTLSIDLFYDGDERVFVKSWKSVSTTYTMSSHNSRMFRYEHSLMRKGPPLQEVLREFEQTPISCQIMGGDFFVQPDASSEVPLYSADEIEVRPNETKEIPISSFTGRSGPSKSFNRIIVKVEEGEILNGEPLESDPDARVFKVGDGAVNVVYRAPGSCSLEGDTIRVYNSCDIAKTRLVPLSKTRQRDEIASSNIVCLGPGWTGTATLRQTYTFECNDTKKPYREVSKLQQRDRRSEEATMSVRCEDFDLSDSPAVALTGSRDIVVAGNHQRSVDEYHFRETTGEGCWSTDLITLKGSGSCAVSPDSLSLSFRKAGTASADEMRRLMHEMSEAISDDPERYQELSAQLDALMNPTGGDGITRLTGIVQFAVDCPFDADYRELSRHKCDSDVEVKENDQGARLEMRGFAVTVEFPATYVRGEDGQDRIEANYPKTTPHSPHAPFTGVRGHDCPPMIETLRFELNLERQPAE